VAKASNPGGKAAPPTLDAEPKRNQHAKKSRIQHVESRFQPSQTDDAHPSNSRLTSTTLIRYAFSLSDRRKLVSRLLFSVKHE
jgi:hypothetical protein